MPQDAGGEGWRVQATPGPAGRGPGKTGVMCGSSFHLWGIQNDIHFNLWYCLTPLVGCSPIFGRLPLELCIQSISCSKQNIFPTKKPPFYWLNINPHLS